MWIKEGKPRKMLHVNQPSGAYNAIRAATVKVPARSGAGSVRNFPRR